MYKTCGMSGTNRTDLLYQDDLSSGSLLLYDKQILQVKSDIDHLFVLVSQTFTTIATLGTASRAIYGPLPYYAVVVYVELVKMLLVVNLAILNASYVLQFFIIFNFR